MRNWPIAINLKLVKVNEMLLPTYDIQETLKRRNALAEMVRQESPEGKALVIIPAKSENYSSYGASRYRPDSYFLYFTGLREPNATLVLDVQADRVESLLFLRPNDPALELWDGARLGLERAPSTLGIDVAFEQNQLAEVLEKRLEKHAYVYHALGRDSALDTLIQERMNLQRNKVRQGVAPIRAIMDFRHHADELRLIKSEWEIVRMRHACQESAEAMKGAMARVKPGVGEHEIMGYLMGEYYRRGLSAPSYNLIVGSHQNACTLHYVDNHAIMPEGALTLIDAGGEYYGYCADITRTVPTAKTFTHAQKIIYEIVHRAHDTALKKVRVGCSFNDYHMAAVREITEGLIGLGWIHGDLDSAIAEERYKLYFMHRTGHFLGMDTHDVGGYRQGDVWRPLQAGMILTVEPGIYIRPAENIPTEFHHIGIRLENDILVTMGEPENLTSAAPINISDIETLKQ